MISNLQYNEIKQWSLYGKYFGYPTCCVEAFCNEESVRDTIFTGTGYLPCKSCGEEEPLTLVHKINKDRVYSVPFTLNNNRAFNRQGIKQI